ncbi:hypothetical protein EG872_16190, partial [Enterococcus faecalis]
LSSPSVCLAGHPAGARPAGMCACEPETGTNTVLGSERGGGDPHPRASLSPLPGGWDVTGRGGGTRRGRVGERDGVGAAVAAARRWSRGPRGRGG